jgi:tripartite ATP-independent transporter DctM subunit
MLSKGYDPKLAGGAVAISGTLAMLIPPSIALILYGVIADISISKLLIAGVIPGLIVTAAIMLTVAIVVLIDPSAAPVGRVYTMREKLASLRGVGPMVILFAAVTAVIYSGITTPTEASAIGAFGALVLALWKRQLSLSTLWACLLRAAQTTCMILLIVLGAHIFGYFFTLSRVTNDIVIWVETLNVAPILVIIFLLAILLILGAFMDQIAILILTVPVFLPLVKALGFDPIWFGVIFVVTAEVGMVTPPMGMNVFVVSRYTGRPVTEVFHGTFPHIIAHLIVIAILTAFPAIILWLPGTM